MSQKKGIRLAVSIFVIIAVALLLPVLSIAGSLEPSDPPGPTMHTLDDLYNKSVWKMFDKEFIDWPDNPRFAVCDNGTTDTDWDDMVLDKETGLVWQRNPWVNEPASSLRVRIASCEVWGWQIAEGLPGRLGWRLPTLQELLSLVDLSRREPALPSGHPFVNLRWGDYPYVYYWTSSPSWYGGGISIVEFKHGYRWFASEDEAHYSWCVRGGNDPLVQR